jgi:hypothetical protein
MAEKYIKKIQMPDSNGTLQTYTVKDPEAADTRITEAEIVALLQTNYKTNHNDHTSIPEDNS